MAVVDFTNLILRHVQTSKTCCRLVLIYNRIADLQQNRRRPWIPTQTTGHVIFKPPKVPSTCKTNKPKGLWSSPRLVGACLRRCCSRYTLGIWDLLLPTQLWVPCLVRSRQIVMALTWYLFHQLRSERIWFQTTLWCASNSGYSKTWLSIWIGPVSKLNR